MPKTRTQQWADAAATKSVEWSYPTSPNAERFGHKKTGCWTVHVGRKTVAAFTSEGAAVVYARTLPNQWCPMYIALKRKA